MTALLRKLRVGLPLLLLALTAARSDFATTQSTRFTASISTTLTKTLNLSTPSATLALASNPLLANGTTNAQADLAWGDTRTIAASSSETLDINGTLFNAFGDAFNSVEVVGILITASAANTNNVVVGNAATNAFVGPNSAGSVTRTITPGGFDFWYSPVGFASTAATLDNIKVANSGAGTSVVYSIIIIARSA